MVICIQTTHPPKVPRLHAGGAATPAAAPPTSQAVMDKVVSWFRSSFQWPILGIGLAILCTLIWCGFLGWIIFYVL